MSKVLGVLLLILAMVVAVTAYSSAQVSNPGTMAIVSANEALLSMRPCEGTGNKDGAIYINDSGAGELEFDFRKGLAGYGNLGFQPNSTYTWDCAFEIHNRTNETLNVWIENGAFPYIDVGAVDRCPGNSWCGFGYEYFVQDGNTRPDSQAILSPDSVIPVSIRFEIPAGVAALSINSSLEVHATAIQE